MTTVEFLVPSPAGVVGGTTQVAQPVSASNPLPVVGSGSGGALPVIITGSLGSDGSTTITLGGTAQNLFAGATPTDGYGVYNPDPNNDLWISDSTTAAANGTGSIRVSANGGFYETPPGFKPYGPVSIVGAVTGQKITARKW